MPGSGGASARRKLRTGSRRRGRTDERGRQRRSAVALKGSRRDVRIGRTRRRPAPCGPRAGRARTAAARCRERAASISPGNAALGTPGAGTRRGRVRRQADDVRVPGPRSWARTGCRRTDRRRSAHTATGSRRSGSCPARGCTSTACPRCTAGPGCSGVPSSGVGAGGGAPLACRWPLGSGYRNSGRPALPQNSSGSMPRFLKAASTHGCRIQYGNRLTSMTLKYGPDAMPSASDAVNLLNVVSTSIRSYLRATSTSLMVLSCVEHVVEVRVVVDEALHLLPRTAHPLQQHADRVGAFVDRGQQGLGVDEQLVDLLAAAAEHARDLVGVGQQLLDLVVALADGVGEPGHPVECGAQVRRGLRDGLRQHVQRLLHRLGVPPGGGLRDVEEGVVDLVRRGGLARAAAPRSASAACRPCGSISRFLRPRIVSVRMLARLSVPTLWPVSE